MRVCLIISYDGTSYAGWQRQLNGLAVQEVLETAIFKATGEKTALIASGRTDSGVHAKGQVAHFDTTSKIPPEKFHLALNAYLPQDIRVLKSFEVAETFHARYGAKKKTYVYTYYISDVALPLLDRFATREEELDLEKMEKAGEILVGERDFKCFLASGSKIKTTVRAIYDLTVKREGELVKISVTGNGFLYNMVRIIAGTLVAVSQGKISRSDLEKALETGDRNLVGKTAPAKGLCLEKVEYI